MKISHVTINLRDYLVMPVVNGEHPMFIEADRIVAVTPSSARNADDPSRHVSQIYVRDCPAAFLVPFPTSEVAAALKKITEPE